MKFLIIVCAIATCGYAAPMNWRPPTSSYGPPLPPPPSAYPAPRPAADQPAYIAAAQQQTNTYVQPKKVVAILSHDFQLDSNGYRYHYESEDNQRKQETGKVIPGTKKQGPYGSEEDDGSLQVQGAYYYQAPDGTPITLTYTADENGFQPKGDHLPTPPPLPQALVDAIAEHQAAVAAVAQYAPVAAPTYQQPASYQPAAAYQRPQYSKY